eukprot:scaffold1198_cov116-Isochrysis_galbana.AAC.4
MKAPGVAAAPLTHLRSSSFSSRSLCALAAASDWPGAEEAELRQDSAGSRHCPAMPCMRPPSPCPSPPLLREASDGSHFQAMACHRASRRRRDAEAKRTNEIRQVGDVGLGAEPPSDPSRPGGLCA